MNRNEVSGFQATGVAVEGKGLADDGILSPSHPPIWAGSASLHAAGASDQPTDDDDVVLIELDDLEVEDDEDEDDEEEEEEDEDEDEEDDDEDDAEDEDEE